MKKLIAPVSVLFCIALVVFSVDQAFHALFMARDWFGVLSFTFYALLVVFAVLMLLGATEEKR